MTHYLVYQVPGILTFVLLTLFLKFFNSKNRRALLGYTIAISLVCVAIIGTNELSLIYLVTTLGLLVYTIWRRKHPNFNYVCAVFICSLVASAIMVLAPGNYVRMGLHPENSGNLIWSVAASFILIPTYFYKWGILLTIASIFYVSLWHKASDHNHASKQLFNVPLGLSCFVFLASLFLMNFAYAWSIGGVPETNVENVIYFYFVIGWFYNLHVALYKFSGRIKAKAPNMLYTAAVMVLLVRIVFDVNNNISSAYLDLLSGNAARHDKELNERYTYLKESGCDVCEIEPLSGMPKSLYVFDLSHDPEEDFPVDNAIKRYWGKEKLYLSKPGPSGPPFYIENLETLHGIGRRIKHKVLGPGNR